MKHVVNTILDILEICEVPYLTTSVVARQLKSEQWAENPKKAYIAAYSSLIQMTHRNKIKYDLDTKVFYPVGQPAPKGTDYLDHNEAVIAIITNLYLKGYDAVWGGRGNSDAIINGKYALELDRRNHTSIKALKNQVEKYAERDDIEKILYVSFPGKCQPPQVKFDKDMQFIKSKGLRKRIQGFRPTKNLKKKLLFATYVEASEPYYDPLKEKIWQDITGRNTTVL